MSTIHSDLQSLGDIVAPGRVRVDIGGTIRRLLAAAVLWQQKRASRLTLRHLTDDELSDIGLTRHEALREVGKSFFWD